MPRPRSSRKLPHTNAELKIDTYIDEAQPFARPILRRLRELILAAHPEIAEDWKWNGPAFSYGGTVCLIWGLKKHASITFSHGSLIDDWAGAFEKRDTTHTAGIKFTDLGQIRDDVILDYVAQACANNAAGNRPQPKSRDHIPIVVPDFLATAFKKDKAAKHFFDNLAPGYRRNNIHWLTQAKREETRRRRLNRLLEALRKGDKTPYM